MDAKKPEKDAHNHQTNIMTCFKNPRQAYLCLSDKDFLGMAAIKYTVDP
jgi:hypothetical protein